MNTWHFKNEEGKVVIKNVTIAKSLRERILGLMFKKNMNADAALMIDPCNSIHTCFMRFSLDVIFLNGDGRVVRKIENMSPWRITRIYFSAVKVIEMKAGTMPKDIAVGDRLQLCIS